VVHEPVARPAARDGHLKRPGDQLGFGDRPHLPADDPAAEAVEHRGQVQHALIGGDLLEIGAPQLVGRGRLEVAADEVRPGADALDAERTAAGAPAAAHVRAGEPL